MKSQSPRGKSTASNSAKAGNTKAGHSGASPSDAPNSGIEQALGIGRAIVDNYAGMPTTPLQVAMALSLSPGSDLFRLLCVSSAAYELTNGSYYSKEIAITPLGKRILLPQDEIDVTFAMREAIVKPRVFRDFINKYRDSALPRSEIALSILTEMGVPSMRAASVQEVILENLRKVGFIGEIKGKQYLDLKGVSASTELIRENRRDTPHFAAREDRPNPSPVSLSPSAEPAPAQPGQMNRRVFVTHGRNKAFIEPIKKFLVYSEMVPVVSAERQTVSKPVPDKVMDDMRSCGAAIIHIDDETTLVDAKGNEHTILNDNVLMEAWGAMALYGRRFILLVKDGIKLPSNLQGLYEVRYSGDLLDSDSTLRLLEAINDIKNNPIPQRYEAA